MNVCQKSCHLKTGTRQTQARNNHTLLSYTSTAVTSVIGDASQVCFPTKVSSLAGVRVGGVRVGSYTHEGVRAKAEKLARVQATRSMVDRSLLTCLSSLYDVHPKLVPGTGRYRTTTHLIRRRARLHRSSGMPAKSTRLFVYLLPYMHEDVRVEGGSTRMKTSSAIDGRTITTVCCQVMMFTRDLY